MATKKFQVEIDINSQDVKIAGGEMLNLQQQLKILQKELKNPELKGEQFQLLSNKVNETEDALKSVKARSGEFFNTVSMLPGPIGQIGNALDSSIGLLKTFSSFSLSNLGSQIKGLGSDIGGIIKSLLGLNTAQNSAAASGTKMAVAEGEAAAASGAATVATNAQSTATKGLTVAQAGATTAAGVLKVALRAIGIGLLVSAVVLLIEYWDKIVAKIKNAVPIFGTVANAISGVVDWFTDLIGVTSEAERAEEARQRRFAAAKANADLKNKDLQREIDLMKAQGKTQDEIDAKVKQQIKNEMSALETKLNDKKMLYGEDATNYKDLQNKLKVIDAEAETRRREAAKTAAEKDAQERQQRNQKHLQDEKQLRDQLAQYVKEGRDAAGITRENELKDEEEKFNTLKSRAEAFGLDITEITKAYQKKREQINKTYDDKEKEDFKKKSKEVLDELDKFLEKYNSKIEKSRSFAQKKENQTLKQRFLDGLITQEQYQQETLESNKRFAEEKQADDEAAFNLEVASLMLKRKNKQISDDDYRAALLKAQEDFDIKQQENQIAVTDASQAIEEGNLNFQKALAQEKINVAQAEFQTKVQLQTAYADAIGSIGGLLKQFAGKNKGLAKAGVILEQGANIAKIVIGAASSISTQTSAANAQAALFPALAPAIMANLARGIATTKIGAAIGVAGAIAGAIQGITQIDKSDQEIAKNDTSKSGGIDKSAGTTKSSVSVVATRAMGGLVSGEGSSTSDSILARISNGEFVMNARATQAFYPMLNTMNEMGKQPQFAAGGFFGAKKRAMAKVEEAKRKRREREMSNVPVKTYVVTTEISNNQQFERVIKQRSVI